MNKPRTTPVPRLFLSLSQSPGCCLTSKSCARSPLRASFSAERRCCSRQSRPRNEKMVYFVLPRIRHSAVLPTWLFARGARQCAIAGSFQVHAQFNGYQPRLEACEDKYCPIVRWRASTVLSLWCSICTNIALRRRLGANDISQIAAMKMRARGIRPFKMTRAGLGAAAGGSHLVSSIVAWAVERRLRRGTAARGGVWQLNTRREKSGSAPAARGRQGVAARIGSGGVSA